MKINYTDEQLKEMFTAKFYYERTCPEEYAEVRRDEKLIKEGKLKADADGRLHLVE